MRLFDRLELIDDPTPRGAALNMAIDEALLESIGSSAVLRVYRWARPSVSFGCFERFAPVRQTYPEREWVRRWTGGGVVEHGEDLTYSLIVPRASSVAAMRPEESYREIHGAIGAGLVLASGGAPKVSQACFENPVRHDLLADGQKVAGAAQRRTKCGLLHQGSIRLLGLDGPELARRLAGEVELRGLGELNRAGELSATRYGAREWTERF